MLASLGHQSRGENELEPASADPPPHQREKTYLAASLQSRSPSRVMVAHTDLNVPCQVDRLVKPLGPTLVVCLTERDQSPASCRKIDDRRSGSLAFVEAPNGYRNISVIGGDLLDDDVREVT